ncbi:MAG: DNA-binding protein [Methylocystis sp.]|uniref:DNA-binding protein n=1 Tax=Methylocystis sp. TaxID=1911079 RepID=UPI003DA36B1F
MQLTIKERLEAGGNLSVKETMALANVGTTKFYADVKAGRIRVRKFGTKSVVAAEDAKAYIAGKPLPQEAA